MDLKEVVDYPKKVDKMMTIEKFKYYFVKTVYGVHKVVGNDGYNVIYGKEFIITRDVKYVYHGGEYDYVNYILEVMKGNIVRDQSGKLRDFTFHHYRLLMHVILYKNVGYISSNFIDQIFDINGSLLVQLWT